MERIIDSVEYDYLAYKKATDKLCEKYSILHRYIIGKSCVGRDITAFKLGKSADYALICAAFHGSEHITTNILLFFLEELCKALTDGASLAGVDARKALVGRGIIFVPRVNPDGCEISIHGSAACGSLGESMARICKRDFTHWNANFRGVDINHNFNAGWKELRELERKSGIYGPSPTRYGGPKPESEPETVALTNLCRTGRIRHATALHTQGEVIYWSFGDKKPPRSEKMAEIMATSSGYALDYPVGLASGGGFKDWFITEFSKPAFTVEIGKGKNPLPIDTAYNLYLRIREMLMLSSIM